jgi:hypothetical protein
MVDTNGNFHHKIAKYCANCGKPLFKWWISKQTDACIFLKFDIICNREECKISDSQFNNIEIKIDLLSKMPDMKIGIETTI